MAASAGMSLLHTAADLVLHLDRHLIELLMRYDVWIYAILFAMIFAETGLVVTPFLPGDSLLFGVGALAAVDRSGSLTDRLGVRAARGRRHRRQLGQLRDRPRRWASGRSAVATASSSSHTCSVREGYFRRHGGLTVLLSRFTPMLRTFAPFVAGIGRMPYLRFQAFNIAGGVSPGWRCSCSAALPSAICRGSRTISAS